MRNTIPLVLIMSLFATTSAFANTGLSACNELEATTQKQHKLKQRNTFLDVRNPRSSQAPSSLNDEISNLKETCQQQVAAMKKKEAESALAQPDMKALEAEIDS